MNKLSGENELTMLQNIASWNKERQLPYIPPKLSILLDIGDAQRFPDIKINLSVFFPGSDQYVFL